VSGLLLAFYWGPRREASRYCAQRLSASIVAMRSLEPEALAQWFTTGRTRQDVRPLETDASSLSSYLEATDGNGLGFHFNIVSLPGGSLESEQYVRLSGHVGSYENIAGTVANALVLEIQGETGEQERRWLRLAPELAIALAESWQPDWGYAGPGALRRQQEASGFSGPFAGYLTYLSPGRRALLTDPMPGATHVTRDGGLMISLIGGTGEPPLAEEVERLAVVLRTSGAFVPTPTTSATLVADSSLPSTSESAADGFPTGASASVTLPVDEGYEGSRAPELVLTLKYPPIAENAPAFASDIIAATRQVDGVELDYSVESLAQVDRILGRFRNERISTEQIAETIFGFGCYLGEVLIRHRGGEWFDFGEAAQSLSRWPFGVRLQDGSIWNPLGKAFKRVEEGPGDSLSYFYGIAG
jgi:hypothetical protein